MATAARTRYAAPRPRNDAYTGLLTISLLAMIVSCILLYLDYNQYGDSKPSNVPKVTMFGSARTLPDDLPPIQTFILVLNHYLNYLRRASPRSTLLVFPLLDRWFTSARLIFFSPLPVRACLMSSHPIQKKESLVSACGSDTLLFTPSYLVSLP